MTNERFTVERADSGSCDAVLVDTEQRWKTEVICFVSQARVGAIEAQLAGSAAPSEGDGRRPVPESLRALSERGTAGEWGGGAGWVFTDPMPDTPSRTLRNVFHESDVPGDECVANTELAAEAVNFVRSLLAASSDPLPPGVHRAPNGALWLLPGAKMPEGYEFRLSRFHAWDTPIPSALAEPVWSDQARELRPLPVPPVPEPEKVPWPECLDRHVMVDGERRKIIRVSMESDDRKPHVNTQSLAEGDFADKALFLPIDADGLVSVLPLGDPK